MARQDGPANSSFTGFGATRPEPMADVPVTGGTHAPRVFSIFTEARFGTTADGDWAAMFPEGPGQPWDRYTQGGDHVRLVVRASRTTRVAADPMPERIEIVPLPYYVGPRGLLRRLPAVVLAVARAVAAADTIVLRVPGVVGSLAAVVCRLTGRRYAVEVIGDPGDVLRAGVLGAVGQRMARPVEAVMRWLVAGAAASRFVTHHSLQHRYPPRPGTPSVAVSNVRLGPDALVSQPRRPPTGPSTVVAIGSQETHYKGHDVLLRALRRLVDDGMDVNLTLIGGGRVHDEIVAVADRLGLTDRVTFTGVLADRARIVELLDAADLFAMPSRTEGMPRALIEAMARALPAVGTAVGGIPELLDPACLVAVEDDEALARAMRSLLTDPTAWAEQSRRNLEVAWTYEESRLRREFLAWLTRVPGARARPRRGDAP